MKLTPLEHATLLSALRIAEAFYYERTREVKLDPRSPETLQRHLKRTQELHALLLNADYIEVIAL